MSNPKTWTFRNPYAQQVKARIGGRSVLVAPNGELAVPVGMPAIMVQVGGLSRMVHQEPRATYRLAPRLDEEDAAPYTDAATETEGT